jgi:hypothetical protein
MYSIRKDFSENEKFLKQFTKRKVVPGEILEDDYARQVMRVRLRLTQLSVQATRAAMHDPTSANVRIYQSFGQRLRKLDTEIAYVDGDRQILAALYPDPDDDLYAYLHLRLEDLMLEALNVKICDKKKKR